MLLVKYKHNTQPWSILLSASFDWCINCKNMQGTCMSNIKFTHSLLKTDSHMACRAHAVSLPFRAAKGLECVFPIWFTQCGRVWFSLATPCPCHAPTMPSSQGHSTARPSSLECVFPIWFTQCGRVWFTLVIPCPCHALTMPFSRPQHSTAVERRQCCGLEKNGTVGAWHMASVNQTRPHCVNQMGKTYSKPLAARHGNGMLCVNRP